MDAPADVAGPTADAVRRAVASDRRGPDAARRQGRSARASSTAAARRGAGPRSMARRDLDRRAESAGVAVWLLRYRHRGLERRRRPGRGRPLGAGPGARGAGSTSRWRCSATRWGPHLGPRRRRPAGPRRRRARPWFPPGEPVAAPRRASGWSPPTAGATGSPPPTPPARTSSGRGHAGADASFVDMGRVGHYLLRRVGGLERASAWSRSLRAPGGLSTRGLAKRNSFVLSCGTKQFRSTPGVSRMVPESASARPRVEGDREQRDPRRHARGARRDRLRPAHHGRRRHRAKASKATLYRRWNTKAGARHRRASAPTRSTRRTPDTGYAARRPARAVLRHGRPRRPARARPSRPPWSPPWRATRSSRRRSAASSSAPSWPRPALIFERARARGEIRDDVDLDLLAPALPGIVLHRVFLLGDSATPELVARVIDQIILPAVHPPLTCSTHITKEPHDRHRSPQAGGRPRLSTAA